MKKKGGDIFRTVLGCYLIFLGVCLWIEVSKKNPSDEQLMIVISLLMIIIGLVYAAFSLKKIIGFSFRTKEDKHLQEEEKEMKAENSAGIRQKKHIMKNVELTNIPSGNSERKKDEKTEKTAAVKESGTREVYTYKGKKVIESIEDIRKVHESEQKAAGEKAESGGDETADERIPEDKKKENKTKAENIENTAEEKIAANKETENAEEIEKDYEEK